MVNDLYKRCSDVNAIYVTLILSYCERYWRIAGRDPISYVRCTLQKYGLKGLG